MTFSKTSSLPAGGLCFGGPRDCVETYASAKSVAVRYAEASAAASTSASASASASASTFASTSASASPSLDTKAVFHLAANGDAVAERVIDDAARSLAVLVINLCRVVDPDVIIFGGGMSQAGETLLHRVRAHVKALSWTVLPTTVQLVIAKSSINAGILGAAMAGKHDAEVEGGVEGGAVGHIIRLHGTTLLAVTTTVSLISLATLAAILLRRRSG